MVEQRVSICIVSFPLVKAFSTPLSNLGQVLAYYCNTKIIYGYYERLDIKHIGNADIHAVPISASESPARFINYILLQLKISYKVLALAKNTDIYFFFMERGPILPMLTVKLLGKRVAWMLPSSIIRMSHAKKELHKSLIARAEIFLQDICYGMANDIFVYSNNLIDEWKLEKYKKKISILHEHFVDTRLFKPCGSFDERENIIGYVGRLSEEKGILNFIKSMPRLLKYDSGLKIMIVGDGPLRDTIAEYIRENRLSSNVKVLGWIGHDDLPQYYRKFRLTVAPSYTEGLPNTVLESMACGTPVIAAPVGAIPDYIKPDYGYILKDNTPDQIASTVIDAIGSPRLGTMSVNAAGFVKDNFSYRSTVDQFKKVIF